MQKIIIGMSLFLAVSVAVWNYYTKANIVYVNNVKLVTEYLPMQQAKQELDKKSKQMFANSDTLAAELQRDLHKYEKERATLPAKERTLTEQILNNKQEQLIGYKEAVQKKMREEEMKVTGDILSQLNKEISEFAEKNNYSLIIGATSSGSVIYGKKGMDVTDNILDWVNKGYKKN